MGTFSANPNGKILSVGELLVDLIPAREGLRLRDTGPILKTASGSAGIFACAAARLGAPSGFVGKVGRDPLSDMVSEALRREGVDTSLLTVSEEGQIGLAFLEYTPEGRNYQYYRSDSVGSRLSPVDIPEAAVSQAAVVHFPGMLLELNENMRAACLRAAELAKRFGAALSFDPNLRREMVRDPSAMDRVRHVLSLADVAAPTLAEARLITGRERLGEVLRALRDLGPRYLALTRDREGAVFCLGDQVLLAEAFPVSEVDPTGAGDTFAAAFCVALREGMGPLRLAAFCNAAGALAVTHRGAIGLALPTRREVDELVDSGACRVREVTLQELE